MNKEIYNDIMDELRKSNYIKTNLIKNTNIRHINKKSNIIIN